MAVESPHQIMNEWTQDPKEILDKIKLLRAAFYLDDQHMLDLLSGNVGKLSEILDVDKIEDYIDESILGSPEICARGGLNSIITRLPTSTSVL